MLGLIVLIRKINQNIQENIVGLVLQDQHKNVAPNEPTQPPHFYKITAKISMLVP